MKYKLNNFIIGLLLLLGIVFLLVSCKKPEDIGSKYKDTKFYIDSFTYEVVENESSVDHELSYSLSFDLVISLHEKTSIRDFTVRMEGKKSFHFTIDYSNTENVTLSSSLDPYPYALLKYTIPNTTSSIKASVKIKLSTTDLMDDINKFLKIDCFNEQGCEFIDNNHVTNEGIFKIEYASTTAIYYEFDEFSESYKVVSIISKDKRIELPASYNNHPVKDIAKNAFQAVLDIEELVLPNTLTSIPTGILEGMNTLKSLTIPFIEDQPLGYLFKEEDKTNAFVPSSLTKVIITKGKSIGSYTFSNCSHLEEIRIPDSITSIGAYAFSGCSSLESISIPSSVKKVGEHAFLDCSAIKKATLPVTAIPHIVKDKLEEVVIIGDGRIEESAFLDCKALETLTLSSGITSIGKSAFEDCTSLREIKIPDSVTTIGAYAFAGCDALISGILGDGVSYIGNRAFSHCRNLKSFIMSNKVKSLDSFVFSECIELKSITLSNAIEHIGEDAFSGCSNLEYTEYSNGCYLGNGENPYLVFLKAKDTTILSCNIHEDTKFIYDFAFDGCGELTSLAIPEGVISIGDNAFNKCGNLKTISVPNSLTNLGENVFYGCSLTHTEYDNGLYLGNNENPYLILEETKSSTITNCSINIKTKFIYQNAFSYHLDLKKITIPEGVISIGKSAFEGCRSLDSISIPDGVMHIGENAFSGCNNLYNKYGADSYLGNFGNSYLVFLRQEMSYTYIINTQTKFIYDFAFKNCKLETIEIPKNVLTIGGYAFQNCENLRSIVISKSVIEIGEYAFHNCNYLKTIYYKGSATDWDQIHISSVANSIINSATRYYFSEVKPTEEGNYWHYVDNIPTKW